MSGAETVGLEEAEGWLEGTKDGVSLGAVECVGEGLGTSDGESLGSIELEGVLEG